MPGARPIPSRRNAGTRRTRCTSLAWSVPTPPLPMPHKPKPTTSKPWPWPRHSACAPPGPLPPRSGHAVCHDGPARAGSYGALDGLRDVPIDGHDLLATSDGGSTDAGGRVMTMGEGHPVSLCYETPKCAHQVAPLLATTPRRKQACLCDVACGSDMRRRCLEDARSAPPRREAAPPPISRRRGRRPRAMRLHATHHGAGADPTALPARVESPHAHHLPRDGARTRRRPAPRRAPRPHRGQRDDSYANRAMAASVAF